MNKIYIFGNGNISFEDFQKHYVEVIRKTFDINNEYIVCDFRGTDTLVQEFLKNLTTKVTILHIGDKSRYYVDKYKTFADKWKYIGGFKSDSERDNVCIDMCTHFIAMDFNSDEKRKSGTLKNLENLKHLNKIQLF